MHAYFAPAPGARLGSRRVTRAGHRRPPVRAVASLAGWEANELAGLACGAALVGLCIGAYRLDALVARGQVNALREAEPGSVWREEAAPAGRDESVGGGGGGAIFRAYDAKKEQP
mmetsp:Transcript_14959/g.49047  ORF Transcript_14959/g.49047 Transcript_14959/m.49047 type:complete len:115 (+) Transcript_14959:14-358(+)